MKKANSDNHLDVKQDLEDSEKYINAENLFEKENLNEKVEIKSFNSNKNIEINYNLIDIPYEIKYQKLNEEKISELKNSEIYKNYNFNKEELEKVKVDITFAELNSKNNSLKCNNKDQTQLAVEFTKNNNKKFPEIGFIIKIIKRLLQIESLNNSFNGNFQNKIKICLFIRF